MLHIDFVFKKSKRALDNQVIDVQFYIINLKYDLNWTKKIKLYF